MVYDAYFDDTPISVRMLNARMVTYRLSDALSING